MSIYDRICFGNVFVVLKCFYHLSQENVFVRLLNLPVVSCTCEMMERTYAGTKQVHPLVSSVCEVYERGVRTAGNLAVRGMRPAIDKLEPQRKLPEKRIHYESHHDIVIEYILSLTATGRLHIFSVFAETDICKLEVIPFRPYMPLVISCTIFLDKT